MVFWKVTTVELLTIVCEKPVNLTVVTFEINATFLQTVKFNRR